MHNFRAAKPPAARNGPVLACNAVPGYGAGYPCRETRHLTSFKEIPMPFINIKITKDGATAEQKAQIIKETTDVMVRVLKKNPATTMVLIEEVETDNWGIGGESVTERRKKA